MSDAYSGFTGDAADWKDWPIDPRDARIHELEAEIVRFKQIADEQANSLTAEMRACDNWRKIAEELAKALDDGTCAMSYMQDTYNKAKAESER